MDSTICEDEEQRSSETKLTLIDKFEINLNSKRFKTFDNLKKKIDTKTEQSNNQIRFHRFKNSRINTYQLIGLNLFNSNRFLIIKFNINQNRFSRR